ncbi:hypothetical protein PMI41_04672 [Phyllobacterium sp. YR531]|nr:hypothetical protein PMI41_04672 [Phyllobacterium sp. YR531]
MENPLNRRKLLSFIPASALLSFSGVTFAKSQKFSSMNDLRLYVMEVLEKMPDMSEITADKKVAALITGKYKGKEFGFDLANLYGRMQAEGDTDVLEAIRQRVVILDSSEAMTKDIKDLVVVLRSQQYVEVTAKQGVKIKHKQIAGKLHAVYMADLPEAMSPFSVQDLPGYSLEELQDISLENVKEKIPDIEKTTVADVVDRFQVGNNTFLSTSLVLLDSFWGSLDNKYPKGAIFVVPRMDELFVIDAAIPGAADIARDVVRITFKEGFSLLSEEVYIHRNNKIQVFEPSN